jgi:Ca2+-binding EF-hand superfamily protein
MNFEIDSYGLRGVFDLLDFDKDGKVDLNEAIEAIDSLGYEQDYPIIFNFMKEMGDGIIDFENFENKINLLLKDTNDDIGLKRIFNMLINNPDKESINLKDLQKICHELGRNLSNDDLENLMNNAGDGNEINFDTFSEFMKSKFS